MSKTTTQQLLDYCGIPSEYQDYREQIVEIPLDAREQILRCMEIPLDSDSAEAFLAEINRKTATQALPDLLMVRDGESIQFNIRQPQTTHSDSLAVRIVTEQGETVHKSLTEYLVGAVDPFVSGGVEYWQATLEISLDLPPGKHKLALLALEADDPVASVELFVVPKTCYEPSPLSRGEKLFGVAMQLYTVKSERNWGMGDFTDLQNFIRLAAPHGIDIVGLNPLHALFPANPHHYSPYSPSNRSFLNVLYIDPEVVPEFAKCRAVRDQVAEQSFQNELKALRALDKVDYWNVSRIKLGAMEALFSWFKDHELPSDSPRANQFREFVEQQGTPLYEHALYEALHEHFVAQDTNFWGWPVWPEEYRDPNNPAVTNFARRHQDRVAYYQYLQWCAFEQLQAAQRSATQAEMAVGIYLDLAVGVDQAGSEAWSNQMLYRLTASVGAPPDALAREGQDWGFPPFDPAAMQRSAYQLFIQNLRASMSCAGAVRYDHAVALLRLWWVPRGQKATKGAYVNYNLQQLLGVIALESWRYNCLVIGEDLGTVPAVLTNTMLDNHLYSYKVLYFEKYKKGGMLPPNEYPRRAVATVTTHDLPTLASWWDQSDLDVREELGLLGDGSIIEEIREARVADKQFLLDALHELGLLEKTNSADIPEMTQALNVAVHLYLAASNAGVMIAQLEDWLGMLEPINIPGTFDEYPNWQRKLTHNIEELFEREHIVNLCQKIRQLR